LRQSLGRLSGLFSLASPPLLLVDSRGGGPGGGLAPVPWGVGLRATRAAWQTGWTHEEVKAIQQPRLLQILPPFPLSSPHYFSLNHPASHHISALFHAPSPSIPHSCCTSPALHTSTSTPLHPSFHLSTAFISDEDPVLMSLFHHAPLQLQNTDWSWNRLMICFQVEIGNAPQMRPGDIPNRIEVPFTPT
ncbi:hypothetical protein KUCAC02_001285, partial [Chaenocephalus aceratus]